MAASEEQFLSLEDVASRLQVSDQTVRRWVKSGKLAAYKPGLEYRIRESDLAEFLKAREVRPKASAPPPDSGLSEAQRLDKLHWMAKTVRDIAEEFRAQREE